MTIEHGNKKKNLAVYPAMLRTPNDKNTINISEAYIKYAKPYAVKLINDQMDA